ncbi:hypothetical protein PV08_07064 [Exophiala spinifera]|uniref:Uncharacterized protein n=1 Tax=Exophiala spinifera TaxID=91928 RepID=A0A0D1ZN56_9EURO|nr:uncharacterized protein PV08_07064 [Exophiala spinifera]KIW14282.1 hypothetical protein PV08_07064 [Exophiala spinifera]
MAMTLHVEVNQQIHENEENKGERNEAQRTAPRFRAALDSPGRGLHKGLMEAVDRYVDCAIERQTIVESYQEKIRELKDSQGRQPATLSEEQIRTGWCTMMLRGCLWSMVHFPIWLPNLPYPSRYWKNNTLVLMA